MTNSQADRIIALLKEISRKLGPDKGPSPVMVTRGKPGPGGAAVEVQRRMETVLAEQAQRPGLRGVRE